MNRIVLVALVLLGSLHGLFAQSSEANSGAVAEPALSDSAIPSLVNFSGVLPGPAGKPLTEPSVVTFLVYGDARGGEPLWVESQTLYPDALGHYSVVLGSTSSQGLPHDLFASGESRWLCIQVPGQVETPRVLLVAVPYALKSRDAETLGGLPASAFMLTKDQAAAAGDASVLPTAVAKASTSTSPASTTSTVSVGLTAPNSDFKVTGSPVKGSGTLALNWNVAPTDQNVAGAIMKRDPTGEVRTSTLVANTLAANSLLQANSASQFYGPMTLGTPGKGLRFRDNGVGVDVESLGVPLYLNWIANQPTAFGNSVGIGTAIPQAELNLNVGGTANKDDLLIGNNSTKGLRLRDSGTGSDLESIGVPLYVNFVTKQPLYLNPNGGAIGLGTANTQIGFSANGEGVAPVLTVGANKGPDGNFYSAYFDNDVIIGGNLRVFGTKNFRMDHPLDPANKYLDHAAIESSEVLNQYSGNVVLDGNGEGQVEFPEWFPAINVDFRYQLTAVGAPAPGLYVAKEIVDRSFTISGGKPGLKVSWQVTARRNDAYMKAHPFVVETEKPASERGH
jgi:hypothetical protein